MAALDLRHVGEAEVPEKPLAAERDHEPGRVRLHSGRRALVGRVLDSGAILPRKEVHQFHCL